jgi:hypothetical protein
LYDIQTFVQVKELILAIDFDGTVVTHDYPYVGQEIPSAVRVLKRIVNAGHKLIIYTMRSNQPLQDAVNWYSEREIPVWGVNKNPTQHKWTESIKIYAHRYIDDAALGVPLIYGQHERPFVDWDKVEKLLEEQDII